MGRKRKDGDPFGLAGTRLALRRGKFWYRHRGTPERWEDMGADLVRAKTRAMLYENPGTNYGTVTYWFGLFLADCERRVKIGQLAERTLKDYQGYAAEDGYLLSAFGKSLPEQIRPHDVQGYVDIGADRGRPVPANRERACLSSMLSWLLRQKECPPGFVVNPCMQASGVVRNEESQRERYVTHAEYREVFDVASRSERMLMALTYRTLQRPDSDIIRWTTAIVVQDGAGRALHFRQNKTQRAVRIALGPDLEPLIPHAVGNVRKLHDPLVKRLDGEAYTYSGISSMLRESIKVANERRKARGIAPMESFGFRDLKGKGATDMWLAGEPIERIQMLCGHADKSTTEKYIKARWRETAQPNAVNLGA